MKKQRALLYINDIISVMDSMYFILIFCITFIFIAKYT